MAILKTVEHSLSIHFKFNINEYLKAQFNQNLVESFFFSKLDFELEYIPADIFIYYSLKYQQCLKFISGDPQFLINCKQLLKKKLGQDKSEALDEDIYQISLACYLDYQFCIFNTLPQYTLDMLQNSSNFIKLDFAGQIQFIKNSEQILYLESGIKILLRDAFSRVNMQNVNQFTNSLYQLHQLAFIEAGKFYAEKILLTDLSQLIYIILANSPQELLLSTIIFLYSNLDFDCYQQGKIQKSTQNSVIFLLRIVHQYQLNEIKLFLVVQFECSLNNHNILGVFAIRELIWLTAEFQQNKFTDSVQRQVDICTLMDNNIILQKLFKQFATLDQTLLSLDIQNFSQYLIVPGCNDIELSDLITLTKNDLLWIYDGQSIHISYKLQGQNVPFLLPLSYSQKHLFNISDVLNFSQIFNLLPFQVNTPLEVQRISQFILCTTRQHFDSLVNYLIFHLQSGRKQQICEIFKLLTISTLKLTRCDAERIGDFLILFYQKIEDQTLIQILFQIQTYYILRLSEKLNAVQALFLSLKLQQILQFKGYLMLIKRLVGDMYGDINEDDSVLLRIICQTFNQIEEEIVEIEIVDCMILNTKQIYIEFSKWK
eukprot:EST45754.1 Hypothetical protein SS50377_14325 [Spironucleus salmonicida]